MKYTKNIENLIDFTLRVRQLEESLFNCDYFKVEGVPVDGGFKSFTLKQSFSYIREARMALGDILRLLGVEHPYQNAYIGKLENENPQYLKNGSLKGFNWEKIVEDNKGSGKSNESICLAYLKNKLGNARDNTGLFYEYLKEIKTAINIAILDSTDHFVITWVHDEYLLYINIIERGLKLCNCYLGLRFGELV